MTVDEWWQRFLATIMTHYGMMTAQNGPAYRFSNWIVKLEATQQDGADAVTVLVVYAAEGVAQAVPGMKQMFATSTDPRSAGMDVARWMRSNE